MIDLKAGKAKEGSKLKDYLDLEDSLMQEIPSTPSSKGPDQMISIMIAKASSTYQSKDGKEEKKVVEKIPRKSQMSKSINLSAQRDEGEAVAMRLKRFE